MTSTTTTAAVGSKRPRDLCALLEQRGAAYRDALAQASAPGATPEQVALAEAALKQVRLTPQEVDACGLPDISTDKLLKRYAKWGYEGHPDGHDMVHGWQVYANARAEARECGLIFTKMQEIIAKIAILCHDHHDHKLAKEHVKTWQQLRRGALGYLKAVHGAELNQNARRCVWVLVYAVIVNASYTNRLRRYTTQGVRDALHALGLNEDQLLEIIKLLASADAKEAVSAIGVARVDEVSRMFYRKMVEKGTATSKEEEDYVTANSLQHCGDKLFRLPYLFSFDVASSQKPLCRYLRLRGVDEAAINAQLQRACDEAAEEIEQKRLRAAQIASGASLSTPEETMYDWRGEAGVNEFSENEEDD